MKIKTKKENEIGLRAFKVGVIVTLIYVLPMCFSMGWIGDTFLTGSTDSLIAIVLWVLVWIYIFCTTPKYLLGLLWKGYGIEFVKRAKRK